ncbi:hypothetical protein D3C80_1339880 [compost metagenome]
MFRFKHITVASNGQCYGLVSDNHHGFEITQILVGAPVLGKLNRCTHQLAWILFQFLFKSIEQRKGICRGTSKSGHNLTFADAAHLAGIALHYRLAKTDLAVTGDYDLPALANRYNRCHQTPVYPKWARYNQADVALSKGLCKVAFGDCNCAGNANTYHYMTRRCNFWIFAVLADKERPSFAWSSQNGRA